jgi:hypothetical protein
VGVIVAVNTTVLLTVLGFCEDPSVAFVATCAGAANAGNKNAQASNAAVPIERQ